MRTETRAEYRFDLSDPVTRDIIARARALKKQPQEPQTEGKQHGNGESLGIADSQLPLVGGSNPSAATNSLSQLVTLSTTRRTSEIHHLFSGCLSSHWQVLFFLASVILSKIADLPWLFLKSLIMSSSVYSKQ